MRFHGLIAALSVALLVAAAPVAEAGASRAQDSRVQNSRLQNRGNAPADTPSRPKFDEADQDGATIPGMPDARFWGDSVTAFERALPAHAGAWLALSGGGSDGAFGAGWVRGSWVKGKYPEFSVITGVSTGALIAPLAFAGPRYEDDLRDAFTTVNSGDVFEAGATRESLFDTWPLRDTLRKYVTSQLLADVAAEHRRGRRLFVLTMNLDAGRPVVWNMGAIAAYGGEAGLDLFRRVLMASSAIPGLFPPVYIAARSAGGSIREMHVDGATNTPFFVAPEPILSGREMTLPMISLTIVANARLAPEFQVVDPSTASILGRAIASALKSATRLAINVVARAVGPRAIPVEVWAVPSSFERVSRGAFDPEYMTALFGVGEREALASAARPAGEIPVTTGAGGDSQGADEEAAAAPPASNGNGR